MGFPMPVFQGLGAWNGILSWVYNQHIKNCAGKKVWMLAKDLWMDESLALLVFFSFRPVGLFVD